MQLGYATDGRISRGTAVRLKPRHPQTTLEFAFADFLSLQSQSARPESDAALQPNE